MKKLLILFFLLFSVSAYSQNKWATVDYTYSSGPVSPEYQYSYHIIINSDGSGNFTYTKDTSKTTNSFHLGRNGMRMLNNALKKSQVLSVDVAKMKSDMNLIGGKSRTLKIVMSQPANTDQPPRVIEVPRFVSSEYSAGVNDLYYTIEMLVPSGVWNRTVK